MPSPLFSIVTVTLNCADQAEATAKSVMAQAFADYQYLVKDGLSTDSTVERLRDLGVAEMVSEPDGGIYDAMNRAIALARGRYVCFLNAGDAFVDPQVLGTVAEHIARWPQVPFFYGDVITHRKHPIYGAGKKGEGRPLLFPDRLSRLTAFLISMCHQSWFVRRELYLEHPLDISFRLKADHEFFYYWILERKVPYRHIPRVLVSYAAGGQSDLNRKLLRKEHRRLLRRYFSPWERALFSAIQRLRQAYRVANFYLRGLIPTD